MAKRLKDPNLLKTFAAIVAASASFRSLHVAWADITMLPHGRLILKVRGRFAMGSLWPLVGLDSPSLNGT
jgi:hypothetical protein